MLVTALIFLACLSDRSTRPALVALHDPIELWASPDVAVRWRSFDHLADPPAPADDAVRLESDSVRSLAGAARIDIFRRVNRRWEWSSGSRFTATRVMTSADVDQRALVRFEGTALYAIGDLPAGSHGPVRLKVMKNLALTGQSPPADVAIYVSSETTPRTLPAGERTFRELPVAGALICGLSERGSHCRIASEETTAIDLGAATGIDVRIMHAAEQAGEEWHVMARGRVAIRPKNVPAIVTRSGSWLAVEATQGAPAWSDVVLDRQSPAIALQRIDGSALPPPPQFLEVGVNHERGLTVRPWVGAEKKPFTDSASMLVVFPEGSSGGSSQVPLATATLDATGVFPLPALAAGAYRVKVMSAACTPRLVPVTLMTGVPADIVFDSGPMVRGRLARQSGGSASDAATVEIGGEVKLADLQQGDPLDRMRSTTAGDDGTFAITVGVPGKYRLHARWGAATADRSFEITDPPKDVDLGDLSLSSGSSLHGVIRDCAGGEATLIAVPDLSKPAIGLADLRRTPIDDRGRFLMDGLTRGSWSVLFRCNGTMFDASPEQVTIGEGDAVGAFTLVRP